METAAIAQWNTGAFKCRRRSLQYPDEMNRSAPLFEACLESKILFAFDVIVSGRSSGCCCELRPIALSNSQDQQLYMIRNTRYQNR
jgi:hypothetical protein